MIGSRFKYVNKRNPSYPHIEVVDFDGKKYQVKWHHRDGVNVAYSDPSIQTVNDWIKEGVIILDESYNVKLIIEKYESDKS